MSSTNTTSPSQETTQTGDPSVRLSLAILKLDQLIIRLGNMGTVTDPSGTNTPLIRSDGKESQATDTLHCDNLPAECRGHQLRPHTRLPPILSNRD